MKTIFNLSLLPVIALAYFFSAKMYVAANYLSAYALIAIFFGAVVYFIYQAGSRLEKPGARIA
ncbi:MAG TPA: hypothetical protein VG101_13970 [Puia sp.]|jgi:hypothetical protein|nr:hypothetical protein [Puia sp.]